MADYTGLARQACRMIAATAATRGAGESVQQSSSVKWDRVWIGMSIATMVAGRIPYGKREHAALAVSGERIAWIGDAEEARSRARAGGIPIEEAEGLWVTPGLIDCHTHLVYGGNRVAE